MSVMGHSDCEHGYRAAGGTFDCPACMADRDAAEYWQGVAMAADEQLRGAVDLLRGIGAMVGARANGADAKAMAAKARAFVASLDHPGGQ